MTQENGTDKHPTEAKIDAEQAQGSVQGGTVGTVIQFFLNFSSRTAILLLLCVVLIVVVVLSVFQIQNHTSNPPSGNTSTSNSTSEAPPPEKPIEVKPIPEFIIENPIFNPRNPLFIKSGNQVANRPEPLNVKYGKVVFHEKGILLEPEDEKQRWRFVLADQNPPEEMMADGEHYVAFGFAGGPMCPEACVVIKNTPPKIRIVAGREKNGNGAFSIEGKAVNELQLPDDRISVEMHYLHDGEDQTMDVPVTVEEDAETGMRYFEFSTAVQGIPDEISKKIDPEADFFGFRITDQAGNTYYQSLSYGQYTAPGRMKLGFEGFANVNVQKVPEGGALRNVVRLTPVAPPLQDRMANGDPALIIKVTGTTRKRDIKIHSNVPDRKSMTLLFRDEKPLGSTLTDEFTDNERLQAGREVAYRAEQEGADGKRYTSNKATIEAREPVMLTLRSNVRDDRVFIDGKAYGKTRLDVELPAGLHLIRVEKPGYTTYEQEIALQKEQTIWAELNPAVVLSVETEPKGATIFADGKPVGNAPLKLEGQTPGKRLKLRAELAGYESAETEVDVKPDAPEPVKIMLSEKENGRLIVKVTPEDAEVTVSGQSGKTPYKTGGVSLDSGGYEVTAAKQGFDTVSKSVTIENGKTTEIEIALVAQAVLPPAGRVIDGPFGMKFARIPPGTFMMGSPESEPGHQSDEKQHKVTLTKGFYMQTTEVTQGQWKAVMGSNPSYFKDCGDNCPVESVSWNDVQEFIKKLNAKGEGTYRLPTEAEWEYAARAETTTPFAFGSCLDTKDANYNGNYPLSGCPRGEDRGKTIPVGSLGKSNAWGLYDMHGNVWEWCADWYGDYPTGSVTDPVGPGTGSSRVDRGGGWNNYAAYCRSAGRFGYSPGYRVAYLGFRLSRTP